MSRRLLKHGGLATPSLLVGFPAGFVLGVLTAPFWGWFEATTGIESLGHSGPADWVYAVLCGGATVSLFVLLEYKFRRE
jgi:hypothetical protein